MKKEDRIYFLISIASDGIALLLSIFLGLLLYENRIGTIGFFFRHLGSLLFLERYNFYVFLCFSAVALLFFQWRNHYTNRKGFWDELKDIVTILGVIFFLQIFLSLAGKWRISLFWTVGAWGFALILLTAARLFLKRVLLRRGKLDRPIIIIGTGENAREASLALLSDPLFGHRIIGFMSFEDGVIERHPYMAQDVFTRPLGPEPLKTLNELGQPLVVIALDDMDQLISRQKLLNRLILTYPNVYIVPPVKGLPLFGLEPIHFFRHEVLILRVQNNLLRFFPRLLKQVFDYFVSIMLVLALSPVLLALMILIRRTSKSVFYGHDRIGKNGKPFKCLKFRTMVSDADKILEAYLRDNPDLKDEWERTFKLKNDPRITKIGAFLRKTSLDELPQLFNVLKGEMSLVGPRPIVEQELCRYGESSEYYLSVKPGLTGLWQISGRNDLDYSDRVYLDTWYVRNWSLWYDFVILIKTFQIVLELKGAY